MHVIGQSRTPSLQHYWSGLATVSYGLITLDKNPQREPDDWLSL
jgi:hypothetical protein